MEPDRQATTGMLSLPAMSTLLAVAPDSVCVALLRHAATTLDAEGGAHTPARVWSAVREPGTAIVHYTLVDGPLSQLQLHFRAEAEVVGCVLWTLCEYSLPSTRLNGILERWQARRDATELRDNVLATLETLLGTHASAPSRALRQGARLSLRAGARLYAAGREWRGEVLDVSDAGIGLVLITRREDAATDVTLLVEHPEAEVELFLHGERNRTPVLVRRAVLRRGGVEVGLQVLEPGITSSLVQRAQARSTSAAAETS